MLGSHLVKRYTALLVLLACPAAGWLTQISGKSVATRDDGEGQNSVIKAHELQTLLDEMQANAALRRPDTPQPTPSSPSCFFQALSALPTSAPCEALSRSDSARVDVAASMALCEIRTAGTVDSKVPRECSDWQRERGKTSTCVEALARSPQYWSSYSGYLREVVTLCSSFRRWADLETARDLHASASRTFANFVEQLKTFESARAHQQATEAAERAEAATELEVLRELLTSLGKSLGRDHEQHTTDLSDIQFSLNSSSSALEHLIHGLRTEISKAAEGAGGRAEERAVQLQQSVQMAREQHSKELQQTASSIGAELSQLVATLSSTIDHLKLQVGAAGTEIDSLSSGLREATKGINSISTASREISSSLAATVQLAEQLQAQQIEIAVHHQHQTQELSQALLNVTRLVEERGSLIGSSLVDVLGLREVAWGLSLLKGLLRGSAPVVLLGLAFLAFVLPTTRALKLLMTLLSTLTAIYPLLISALTLLRLLRSLRLPRPPQAPPPPRPSSSLSTEALAATHFALANPPSSARAGIGSPGRRSRATRAGAANLYLDS